MAVPQDIKALAAQVDQLNKEMTALLAALARDLGSLEERISQNDERIRRNSAQIERLRVRSKTAPQ